MNAIRLVEHDLTYRVAVLAQWTKLLVWVDDESVSRHYALLVVVHDGDETIGGRLRADTDAWKISADGKVVEND